jgi:undecaprenyl-diphosphatase
MGFFEAILLAVVQGATEFLPISSSGHLVLGQTFLGISEPQLLFDIVLHVGTLLAVVVFYRDSIRDIVVDSWSGAQNVVRTGKPASFFDGEGARVAALVGLATIPTGLLGVALERLLDPEGGERIITASVVCGVLIVNGFILITHRWLDEREVERDGLLTVWKLTLLGALFIGLAQGVAVLPGISRSGTTITAALLVGVTRTQAARFSFLLSIPAILGALVLKFDPTVFAGSTDGLFVFILGALVAAVVGYLCLRLLVLLLERAQFHHFAWYCWIVGIAGLIAL